MSEEEKGMRISVTFPSKDAEWLQKQVDTGEYTSLAEVVRMSVRTMRTGGPGIRATDEGLTIPTEVAVEAVRNVDALKGVIGEVSALMGEKKGKQGKPPEPPQPEE